MARAESSVPSLITVIARPPIIAFSWVSKQVTITDHISASPWPRQPGSSLLLPMLFLSFPSDPSSVAHAESIISSFQAISQIPQVASHRALIGESGSMIHHRVIGRRKSSRTHQGLDRKSGSMIRHQVIESSPGSKSISSCNSQVADLLAVAGKLPTSHAAIAALWPLPNPCLQPARLLRRQLWPQLLSHCVQPAIFLIPPY